MKCRQGDASMNRTHERTALTVVAALLLASPVPGCGSREAADPDKARAHSGHGTRRLARRANNRRSDDWQPADRRGRSRVESRVQAVALPSSRDQFSRGLRPEDPCRTLVAGSARQAQARESQVHRQRRTIANGDPSPVLTLMKARTSSKSSTFGISNLAARGLR